MKQSSPRCSLIALALGLATGCNADRRLPATLDGAVAEPNGSEPIQKPLPARPEPRDAEAVEAGAPSNLPRPAVEDASAAHDAGPSPDEPLPGPLPDAGSPSPDKLPDPRPDASNPESDASAPAPDASSPAPPTPPVTTPPDVDVDPSALVVFTDVGAAAGIGPFFMATGPRAGVAAEDYDGDGFIDLFVPTGEGFPDQLYRNLGDGTFEDIAPHVGLDSLQKHRTALWFDADGDEDLDLVIASDCRDLHPVDSGIPCPVVENLWLYKQGADGRFRDVSRSAGFEVAWGGTPNQHRAGMAAGDIDGDGDLDLVVPGWQMRAYVFQNDGSGSFTDITEAAGVSIDPLFYQRAVLHDFNRDGHLDIYFAIDIYQPNALYLNQGDGTFRDEAAAAGVDNASTDMGVTIGDYDNDGDFDFYVTVISQDTHANKLYRNDSDAGTLAYSDVASELGVSIGGWGWGTTFFDADNDGWLDLATTNGSAQGARFARDPSRFWLNPGAMSGTFQDASSSSGFDDLDVASGLLATDYDRDGDLDLLQAVNDGGPLRLLQNQRQNDAATNHYLVVRPRLPGTKNAWAIGATVTARAGEFSQVRPIHAGISTDSQEPAEAHFGLGAATLVDELTVTWPNGEVTVVEGVTADQVLTVTP